MPYGQTSMPRYQGHHGRGVIGGVIDVVHTEGTDFFADPGPGEEFSYTTPDDEIWEILGLSLTFATDGTNIQRTVNFEILGPDDHRLFVAAFAAKDASTTVDLLLAQWGHAPQDITNTDSSEDEISRAPIPRRLMLPPGSTIRTNTVNLQDGDDFSNPHGLVERFAVS